MFTGKTKTRKLNKSDLIGRLHSSEVAAKGNGQHMWWESALTNSQLNGSFWIYDMKKAEKHHGVFTGKNKTRKLQKNELIGRLHSSRVVEKGITHYMWWYPDLLYIQLTVSFWIYNMEKSEQHHDVFTGKTKNRKLNKNELIDRLH